MTKLCAHGNINDAPAGLACLHCEKEAKLEAASRAYAPGVWRLIDAQNPMAGPMTKQRMIDAMRRAFDTAHVL